MELQRGFAAVRHTLVDTVKIPVHQNEPLRLANCQARIPRSGRQSEERRYEKGLNAEFFTDSIGVQKDEFVTVSSLPYHEKLIGHELQRELAL